MEIGKLLEYGVKFLYNACMTSFFRQDAPMTLTADLFWSFRSPYSYLAIGRYRALAASHDVTINLRPVYPLAIRQPDFFERNHPNWLSYTMRDMIRVAQFHGIPFGPPRPDPIVQNVATREIAAEQPYIYRLTRAGQAAARRGKGLGFAHEVGQLIWGGAVDWHLGDHLAGAARRAGLNLAELDVEAVDDAAALDNEIAGNQVALEIAGHWGVPTLVFEGEPFFGQDRIEMAKWRMEQKGLRAR
jgi:2-hydroxychromene-2-carboxylate isomerase